MQEKTVTASVFGGDFFGEDNQGFFGGGGPASFKGDLRNVTFLPPSFLAS